MKVSNNGSAKRERWHFTGEQNRRFSDAHSEVR